jgi:hypothetical protein
MGEAARAWLRLRLNEGSTKEPRRRKTMMGREAEIGGFRFRDPSARTFITEHGRWLDFTGAKKA